MGGLRGLVGNVRRGVGRRRAAVRATRNANRRNNVGFVGRVRNTVKAAISGNKQTS